MGVHCSLAMFDEVSEGVRAYALDPVRAAALWDKSEELVGRALRAAAEAGALPCSQTLKAASRHRPDCARLQAMLPHVDSCFMSIYSSFEAHRRSELEAE